MSCCDKQHFHNKWHIILQGRYRGEDRTCEKMSIFVVHKTTMDVTLCGRIVLKVLSPLNLIAGNLFVYLQYVAEVCKYVFIQNVIIYMNGICIIYI